MSDASETIGLRHGELAIVRYDPVWAELFEQECARIHAALPGIELTVDHIGSTAVPGLSAKPILDIAVRVQPIDEHRIAAALVRLGYVDRGIRSGRLFIRLRGTDIRTHNVHLYAPDDTDYRDQLLFRDALREDAALRESYAALKRDLLEQLGGARAGYADGKNGFVRTVLASLG